MPTYSYACTECGDRFDVVQAFTDDALTTCDRCSGHLRKLFSPVGVVFKGSGFYHNDSRAARKAATNGHSKSDASTGNGSGDQSGSTEKSTASTTSSDKNGNSAAGASSTAAATTSG